MADVLPGRVDGVDIAATRRALSPGSSPAAAAGFAPPDGDHARQWLGAAPLSLREPVEPASDGSIEPIDAPAGDGDRAEGQPSGRDGGNDP